MTPATVTETATETAIETGTAIEIVTGTGTGTGTETEPGTAIETGTGPEIARHAEIVETAARVGAISSGTDLRIESSGNKPRVQHPEVRASCLAPYQSLGHGQLKWTGKNATIMWRSRSPPGLLLCGVPWLLATVRKGYIGVYLNLIVCSPIFFSRLDELPLTATTRVVLMWTSKGLLLSPRQ